MRARVSNAERFSDHDAAPLAVSDTVAVASPHHAAVVAQVRGSPLLSTHKTSRVALLWLVGDGGHELVSVATLLKRNVHVGAHAVAGSVYHLSLFDKVLHSWCATDITFRIAILSTLRIIRVLFLDLNKLRSCAILTLDMTLSTRGHITITCEDHLRSSARHRLDLHLLIFILFECENELFVLLFQVLNDALLLRVLFHQQTGLLLKFFVDRQELSPIS